MFKILALTVLLLFSNFLYARPCIPPKEPNCMAVRPDIVAINIKIKFKKSKPEQIIYLNGGCELREQKIYKFSSLEKLSYSVDERPSPGANLNFKLCIGDNLISEQDVPIDEHGIIECVVNEAMICITKPFD